MGVGGQKIVDSVPENLTGNQRAMFTLRQAGESDEKIRNFFAARQVPQEEIDALIPPPAPVKPAVPSRKPDVT